MARPWYLAPSLVRLRAQVNTRWPDRSKVSDGTIGDRAHAARTSDHNPDPKTGVVRALDLTATGSMAATICAAAVADPRVAYVIHNKRIWTPSRGWDTYTGTNPHSNHVHISIAHTKAAEDDTKNWKGIGMAGMTSPAQGRVSSEYGRRAPIPGVTSGTFHAGIDIANKVGTPVYAAFAGTVISAGTNGVPGRSGKYILIQNPDGERQYYGHLNKIRVKAGQKVKQGQRIGDMGATGNVTGPHLHFEIWRNSSHTSHRNPRIDFRHFGITPGSKPKATSSAPKPKPAPKPAKGKEWPHKKLLEDGKFQILTKKAYQRLLTPESVGNYTGKIDGDFATMSVKAEQRWLKKHGYYHGRIDGKRQVLTIKGVQALLYDRGFYRNGNYSKAVMVDGKWQRLSIIGLQKLINSQANLYK